MAILLSCFQNLQLPKEKADVIFRFLEDQTTDEDFIQGIKKLCREVRDIYPTTNLVALILEKSREVDDALRVRKWLSES
jgi:hypothetical protein